MAGLYIHIPFCTSRCIYCGFYSTTLHNLHEAYINALAHEMTLRRSYLHEDIHTIYIGGGTPSLLTEEQLCRIFDFIDHDKATEITIECNPDDITKEYADMISRLPVSRVSLGAQTFCEERLMFIRRRHKSQDIGNAVNRLRDAGITNISIDLMFGFPDETMEEWQNDISKAIALNVEHLSAYCLMFEAGTPLYHMLRQGKVKEIDEELSTAMYGELIDSLKDAGYEHYEISNFARPGYQSLHNSNYWTGIPYIGIGAAAHSFDIESRQWNINDVNKYINAIERGEIPMEREVLDRDTQYNDTVMLSLRTHKGIDLTAISHHFGDKYLSACLCAAKRYIDNRLLEHTSDNHLRLTRRGILVSDMIMSDMMRVS